MKKIVIVEDTYARHALEQALRRRGLNLRDIYVVHIPVCSTKMERMARSYKALGTKVIVVADAENEQPESRERWIRSRHNLANDSAVIIVDPCMEALACIALGLRGCRSKPCSNGPLAAVDAYWRRKRRRGYAKRMLSVLFRDADNAGGLERAPEFRRLLEELRDP